MKRWKKMIAALVMLMILLPQTLTGADAATVSWQQNEKGYWYSFSDGSYAQNEWLQDGNKWYYFNANGYMVTGWREIKGYWYYFGSGGAMQVGWQKIKNKWYYFQSSGHMKTGWLELKDKWYYFGEDGAMVTGKVTIKGKEYSFDSNGVWVTKASGLASLQKAEVGNSVVFGSYEQDNDSSNGKEEIEWIVLDKKSDGSLFLLSTYGLDQYSYNRSYVDMTWEKSHMRGWLNSTFYTTAFSSAEQAKILTTTVVNEDNPYTGTDGGNNTSDKVFLLSYSEVKKYFDADRQSEQGYTINPDRACKATAYAISRNSYTYDFRRDYYAEDMKEFTGCCCWWLRSPGSNARRAAYVNNLGDAYYYSFYVYNTDGTVRPALWVKP